MEFFRKLSAGVSALALIAATVPAPASAQSSESASIQHVLLISVDGMHAVDFLNCAKGVSPSIAANPTARQSLPLAIRDQLRRRQHLETLGFLPRPDGHHHRRSPALTGVYYDVAYSRNSRRTCGHDWQRKRGSGTCNAGAAPTGFTTEYEEGIDIDQTKVNGGAPGAALTDGGIHSIIPRDCLAIPPRAARRSGRGNSFARTASSA